MFWSSLLALSLRMPRDGINSPGPPERCSEHRLRLLEGGSVIENVPTPPQPGSPGFPRSPGCCLDGNPLSSSQMTSAWKTVACGGTRDQLFMQEKARQLLGRLKPSHTSRTLILS